MAASIFIFSALIQMIRLKTIIFALSTLVCRWLQKWAMVYIIHSALKTYSFTQLLHFSQKGPFQWLIITKILVLLIFKLPFLFFSLKRIEKLILECILLFIKIHFIIFNKWIRSEFLSKKLRKLDVSDIDWLVWLVVLMFKYFVILNFRSILALALILWLLLALLLNSWQIKNLKSIYAHLFST